MKNVGALGRAVLIAGTLIALGGCQKQEPARWDIDLLGPLVKTSLSINDLIPDSLLITDDNGYISLLYRDELFALRLDTVINYPDTSFLYNYSLPIAGPIDIAAGVTPFNQNDVTNFDLGDVALRTLILREGYLDLELKNMVASTVLGHFTLPGASLPGGPPVLDLSVPAGSPASPAIANTSLDLSGAVLDLRGPEFNQVNTLGTQISIQLDPNGNGATVTNLDSIIAKATYRDLVPQYARGYFGTRTIDVGPDGADLDIFDRIIDGSIDLDQVTLRILLENGLGVDIQAYLEEFRAENTRTGVSVDLSHAIMNGPINLNRAQEDGGGGFQPSFYVNELDNSDSNVDEFVESLPDRINYELELHMNPLGDISNGNDFLYHDSKVRAELELEIPLHLIASNLTLETFADPNMPGSLEHHALQSGDLKIFANNGFPFSAGLVIDIVDDELNLLSAVPIQGTINSAILGSDLLVQLEVSSELTTSLTSDQVDLLYQGGKFRIRTIFNTADQTQHVRILDSYELHLQITAGAHYVVNGDD
ncbi:MAG: hypothetical protein M3R08_06765, partial [Bacteroidota bacterium]|nr:hypothetical protein [Bacteroidota bacterium]